MTDFIFMTTPYSDPDPDVRDGRRQFAALAAAHLVRQGAFVHCPVLLIDEMRRALEAQAPGGEYWKAYDDALMASAQSIVVLQVPGWDKSGGVKRETAAFSDTGRPVAYLDPATVLADTPPETLARQPASLWAALPAGLAGQYGPASARQPAAGAPALRP